MSKQTFILATMFMICQICATAEYATQITQAEHGYGRHVAYVSPSDVTLNGEVGYVAQLVWVWTVTLVKTSMCLLLLRIRPSWYWGMISFMIFQLAVGFATTAVHFTRCSPIAANWNPTLPNTRCWSTRDISNSYYVLSGIKSRSYLYLIRANISVKHCSSPPILFSPFYQSASSTRSGALCGRRSYLHFLWDLVFSPALVLLLKWH
jgi:rhodopsin domain-containing protein